MPDWERRAGSSGISLSLDTFYIILASTQRHKEKAYITADEHRYGQWQRR
jgi:hypothetical protein